MLHFAKAINKGKKQQEDKNQSESSADFDEHQPNAKWVNGVMIANIL